MNSVQRQLAMFLRRPLWLTALAVAALSLAGCGGPSGPPCFKVTGTVTKGGQPLEVKGRDVGQGMVQVCFYLLNEQGQLAGEHWDSTVNAQGHYKVFGPSGKGIPAGKYRVAVFQWDPYPGIDKLKGAFSEKKSPVVRDITAATEIDLDLDKVGPAPAPK